MLEFLEDYRTAQAFDFRVVAFLGSGPRIGRSTRMHV